MKLRHILSKHLVEKILLGELSVVLNGGKSVV
jgi:hypothetical protein